MEYLKHAGSLYYLMYYNAIALTILTTMFIANLYLIARKLNPSLAIMGFIFLPMYSIINLIVYGS